MWSVWFLCCEEYKKLTQFDEDISTPKTQLYTHQGCIYLDKNIVKIVILFLIDGTKDFRQMIKIITSIEGVKTLYNRLIECLSYLKTCMQHVSNMLIMLKHASNMVIMLKM